jgi:hypothetical protein
MRDLLAGLVPGLPDDAAARIIARADGVPLYAVEIVRMLVAQGALEAADGVYRPVGNLADLAVPDTLHSLIAARLDGLEPADRALLQAAAVLGHSFTVDLAAVGPRRHGRERARWPSSAGAARRHPRPSARRRVRQSLVREVAH